MRSVCAWIARAKEFFFSSRRRHTRCSRDWSSDVCSYDLIVLLLTALCVMAAMTNVAIERRMDVGLMKAIGGATRGVVRLFPSGAAPPGPAGGGVGGAPRGLLSFRLWEDRFCCGAGARPCVGC